MYHDCFSYVFAEHALYCNDGCIQIHHSAYNLEAPLLLLLVTYSRSGVGSTFDARLCMAKTLKYLL